MTWLGRLRAFDKVEILRLVPFLVLIVLAAGLSYRYHALLQDQRARVEHTYQVVTRLDAALISLLDAETGQRGYLVTGDELYLEPYLRAESAAPAALGELRRLVSDSALQQRRVDDLFGLIRAKFAELSETVEVRRQKGLEAARVVVLRDTGRATMDQVRSVIGAMERTEHDLLAERAHALHDTEHRLLATTVVCASLSVAARLGLNALAWRRRQKSS